MSNNCAYRSIGLSCHTLVVSRPGERYNWEVPKLFQKFFYRVFLSVTVLAFALVVSLGFPKTTNAQVEYTEQAAEASLIDQNHTLNSTGFWGKENEISSWAILALKGTPSTSDGLNVTWSGSATQAAGKVIASMYKNPAASTERYLAYVMRSAKINVAQPAYAQGLGFASLDPILDAWIKFRNVAYLFFVLIMLAIGFMIMFRQRIGGQTVVTAQQALPSVVMSLLAVTFSFAIAGFLIDMMYLIMGMIIALFNPADFANSVLGRDGGVSLMSINFLQLGWILVSNSTQDAFSATWLTVEAFFGQPWATPFEILGQVIGSTIALLVVAIAIVISVFRLFYILLRTYISILVSVVLSPLILMMGAIPGRNTFGPWIKGLIGNLSAFPTVLFIIILYGTLTSNLTFSEEAGNYSAGFMPPYLVGNSEPELLNFLIGLGTLMLLPELVTKAKEMMGAKGGVFEQLAGDLSKRTREGWTGDYELVPGLGFTKLSNMGISGRQLSYKGFRGTDEGRKAAQEEGTWRGRAARWTGSRGVVPELWSAYKTSQDIDHEKKTYEPADKDQTAGSTTPTRPDTGKPPVQA